MSHKVNAKAIGAFTILACILLISGVFTFGGGDWFRAEYEVEMVFTGSVKGLTTGSPITFRGVRIGEVREINLDFVDSGTDIIIRVVGVLVQGEDSRFANRKELYIFLDKQILKGLRAQLVAQSIVTGRLQIQLEYFPEQKGYLILDENDNLDIPTVPTDFEVVSETLKNLAMRVDEIPIVAIAQHLDEAITSFNRLVNTEKIDSSLDHLNASLIQFNQLLSGLNAERDKFFQDYYKTTSAFRGMAAKVSNASDKSERLMTQTKQVVDGLDEVFQQAQGTLKTYDDLVAPGSDVRIRLLKTLDSIERSAEQFRQLGETLERNPESVLTGKQR